MKPGQRTRLALLCALFAAETAGPVWAAPIRAAVFSFQLVDTSAQGTQGQSKAETDRLAMLDSALKEKLQSAGYQLVSTAPVAKEIKQQDMLDCQTCAADFARQLGADVAVTGWVQKVSNLILNINLVVRDANTDKVLRAGSVSIRSNTDESWKRGLDYLLSERILTKGVAAAQ